jgi:hypothetical protein
MEKSDLSLPDLLRLRMLAPFPTFLRASSGSGPLAVPCRVAALGGPSLDNFRQVGNVQRCDVDAFFRGGGISR